MKAVEISNSMPHPMEPKATAILGVFITGILMLGTYHWPQNNLEVV